jgi:hypothetical protein
MQVSNGIQSRESTPAGSNKVQAEKSQTTESKSDTINIADIFVARQEAEKLEASSESTENKAEQEQEKDPNEKSFYEKLHDERQDNIFKYMQMASSSRLSEIDDPSLSEYGSEE